MMLIVIIDFFSLFYRSQLQVKFSGAAALPPRIV